ncbi:nephrin-like [Penaeus vannamei]|uniref:nephrin-like n=1 Tax=Penaeus vannamei TaxID=6689 RepID=UPI00387F45CC
MCRAEQKPTIKYLPKSSIGLECCRHVPPDSVRIVDRNGNEKSSTIGPYVLGQTLSLKCVATGGRPPPKLTWWAGHKEVRGQVSDGDGEVSNTLTVPSLLRHHLDQSFICQATNSEKAVPVTAAVTIDMTLPPMSINLMGVENPISAGVGVTAVCLVVGARPPPTVTWWLDGRLLRATGERSRDEGNVTESHVVVVAAPSDQGRYLACRAETPGLLHSVLEDGTKLTVHYVPKVNISLGPRLSLDSIKEGGDVYFSCSVSAVPPPAKVEWYHNPAVAFPGVAAGNPSRKPTEWVPATGLPVAPNPALILMQMNVHKFGPRRSPPSGTRVITLVSDDDAATLSGLVIAEYVQLTTDEDEAIKMILSDYNTIFVSINTEDSLEELNDDILETR